jgi:hypothetical protein
MSFNPSEHPRDESGQFAEKTGTVPEVRLSHSSMIEALRAQKMTTPIALGNLLDDLDQDFIEDIADYHVGMGQPGLEGYSGSDCDTLHCALNTTPEHSGDVFARRYVASLEGEDIAVYVGDENTAGNVTATDGRSVQLDNEDVWYDLGDSENVRFERRSYDIGTIESKTAKAAREISAWRQ